MAGNVSFGFSRRAPEEPQELRESANYQTTDPAVKAAVARRTAAFGKSPLCTWRRNAHETHPLDAVARTLQAATQSALCVHDLDAYRRALDAETAFYLYVVETEKIRQTFGVAMQVAAQVAEQGLLTAPPAEPKPTGVAACADPPSGPVGSEDWLRAQAETIHREKGKMLESAVRIGLALADVREHVPHGRWTRFLSDDAKVNERTARNYIQLATTFASDPSNRLRVADLTVRNALLVCNKLPTPGAARAFVAEWHEIPGHPGSAVAVDKMSEAQLRAVLREYRPGANDGPVIDVGPG